jgi:cobalt-precorrin-5B (C1)-methyltransferase
MIESLPQSGYTLPVFACAAAIAALQSLRGPQTISQVAIDLLEPPKIVEIPIEQVAQLCPRSALGIARSDPGDNLDLTRNTPIWARVEWAPADQSESVVLIGGEGLGKHQADQSPAIYGYAQQLLRTNLHKTLMPGEKIRVTLILPEGRALATRTSNAAFGVVEGLSLLGTSGISQPLSAPGQLEVFREDLRQKQAQHDCLVFCIGENGLDLIQTLGVDAACLVKTANWLGPMLVEAGMQAVPAILLFGYHGKLMKLAGGIFHSHHQVADGRLEILTAHCANLGLPTADLQAIFASPTAEAGLTYLRTLDSRTGSTWVAQVYGAIAQKIDQRAQDYIKTHSDRAVQVGTVLFDRRRQVIVESVIGATLFSRLLTRL